MEDMVPPDLRLGCPQLDNDHEVLFGLLARLTEAITKHRTVDVLDHLMVDLDAYFDAHFENEEDLMAKTNYPAVKSHQAEHDRMRAQCRQLAANIQHGDCASAQLILRLLHAWIREHVIDVDRLLAQHLIRLGLADSVAAH